jgi:hypothetical protein
MGRVEINLVSTTSSLSKIVGFFKIWLVYLVEFNCDSYAFATERKAESKQIAGG